MTDTQWPRFEVFEKERPDWPHRNAGAVHAPDDEMALLNARDVFVRRPNCLSLWVVPTGKIFAKTAQELQEASWQGSSVDSTVSSEKYLVFQKQTQRATETYVVHVGEVEARSPQEALRRALETFSHENVFVWWVCPARAVTRSEDSDIASMFAPANTKLYRQPGYYHVVTLMQEIKSGKAEDREAE